MNKAILISIRPRWVAKILNGEKTIEIRKKFSKDYVGWVYIYCTKDNHQLVKPKDYDKYLLFTKGAVNYSHEQTLNGKVVAKFTLNKVKKISRYDTIKTSSLEQTCLSAEELWNYAKEFTYFWHISNLVIFDEPKELSEFSGIKANGLTYMLEKAPQSWCYVEVE